MSPKAKQATLQIGGRAALQAFDAFKLVVIEGPDEGLTARASAREIAVGTAPGNELVLRDPAVSRHHVSVASIDDSLALKDLGSTNGTRVGSCRVREAILDDGAIIEIGRSKLRLSLIDETIVEPLASEDSFDHVFGKSATMRRLFALLPRIAASESSVLIEGETGTGKGRIAEAIHRTSARAAGPFVILDCSAIPPTLIESELFGHEKGSFTGAVGERAGAFEQAKGGTIFLDEIGELPIDMQPKLLRAIEDRTVKRVGASKPTQLDVRIVAATNRDLREEVNRGTFRADLYFRLHVVRLVVPPLRDRREDIELLAKHFHEEFAPGKSISPELLTALSRQSWPGNVRELRSSIERSILFGGYDPTLSPPSSGDYRPDVAGGAGSDPTHRFDPNVPFRVAKDRATSEWEAIYLQNLISHVGGNLSEASRIASMDRTHLRDLLKKYGLRG